MAFRVNSQIELSPFFGSCWQLSEYQKKQLKKTWAYDYAEKVFPKINEERFGVMYSQNQASRPNTPINILVSILFLKKLLNMTDEEMIQAVDFDYLMKYALHLNSCPGQVVDYQSFPSAPGAVHGRNRHRPPQRREPSTCGCFLQRNEYIRHL